jgi:hypothetical protein
MDTNETMEPLTQLGKRIVEARKKAREAWDYYSKQVDDAGDMGSTSHIDSYSARRYDDLVRELERQAIQAVVELGQPTEQKGART